MLTFTGTEQHYPEIKSAEERRKDFEEIYAQFDPAEAAVQASRCSQCGIPFCQIHRARAEIAAIQNSCIRNPFIN